MSERDRFENWARDVGHTHLDRFENFSGPGDYVDHMVRDEWTGWQAALANDPRRSVQDVEDALAGVEYALSSAGGTVYAPPLRACRDLLQWFLHRLDVKGNPVEMLAQKGRELREAKEA